MGRGWLKKKPLREKRRNESLYFKTIGGRRFLVFFMLARADK
jgi:hypothetical protein